MYEEIVKKIKEYDTILIARHIGVDPDALCSQLALRDSIKLTYPDKKVLAVGTGSSRFISIGKLDKYEKVNNALIIICDTPDKRRVDGLDFDSGTYSIKIDHHPFIEKYCDLELIEDSMSSTCEIIMNMIYNTELKCDDSIAELLYMGLVSDSNRFLFNSCNYKTFESVTKLMKDYNFDLEMAYQKLYMRPLNEVRFEGYIGQNFIVTDNKLAYIVISDEIVNKFEVDSASAGNMINDFNFINDVLVWVTITEDIKNKQYRVSIRSRGPEINRIAEKHNGGGHRFAAGAKPATLDEAMDLVNDIDKELQRYNNVE